MREIKGTTKTTKNPQNTKCSAGLAEKEGFEPSRQLPQPTPLAGDMSMAKYIENMSISAFRVRYREFLFRDKRAFRYRTQIVGYSPKRSSAVSAYSFCSRSFNVCFASPSKMVTPLLFV